MRAPYLSVILFLLCIFHTAFTSANEQQTWKIISLEWPPYASSKMANGGDAIALLRDSLAAEGIALSVEYLPWQDALKKAEQPGYLGYYPAWLSEIQAGFIASSPILTSQLAVMTSQSSVQHFESIEQLFNESKVGIVGAYIYPDEVEKVIQAYESSIIRAANDEELFHLLQTNQINFAIAAPEVFNYFATQQNVSKPHIVSQFVDSPLVIGIRNAPENREKATRLQSLFNINNLETMVYTKPKKLLLTYIDIPSISPFNEFISQIYDDIGIKTQIQATPARRGLLLLNAGIIDADVVRAKSIIKEFENVVVVEPSLSVINILLLCRQALPCSREILYDPSKNIISTTGNTELLSEFDIKARITHNEALNHSLDLLRKKRINYILYPALENELASLKKEFHVIVLRQLAVNTVINKKHAALVPELSKAIKARLPELKRQLDKDNIDQSNLPKN